MSILSIVQLPLEMIAACPRLSDPSIRFWRIVGFSIGKTAHV